jgi:hypothetical protein
MRSWLSWIALAATLPAPQETRPGAVPGSVERVVVLGASLSSGFNLPRGLDAALEASLAAEHEPVRAAASEMFFLSPLSSGPQLLERALEAEPTLVVALDYLFWFGYGTIDARGSPLESEEERLALLEKGLASLAELECPLVVGDFPDMSAAVGKMLLPEQMPEPATLERLSRRVRAWAAEREATLVLPLAELVRALGSEEELRIGRHAFPAGSRLLQPDQLHPTPEGMAAVAQLVADELVKHGLARETDFRWELAGIVAALRAEAAPAAAPTPH